MSDRRLWIIFLIIFVNMVGYGVILPLLPYYVESFHAGPITLGFLSAAYSLFQLLSAPLLGELSDKFGRRPILLFSIGGTAISFILLGLANSLPLLFLSRIIDGISGGNISTAQAYIADITSQENRTQGMGVMMAAFSLGFILGPALGGVLSVYGYAVPALVAGAVAAVATVLTVFFLPESIRVGEPHRPVKKRNKIFNLRDFYDALTHPEVGIFLTITFLVMFAFSLMQGIFALFTEHALHFTAETNGLIFAYLGVIGVVIQIFFLKRILGWLPELPAIAVSILSMALSLALIAVSSNLPLLLVAVTLLAFGNSVSGPILAGLISKHTPASEQGNILGVNQSIGSVARLIGPITGTFIYSQISDTAPFFMAAVILGLTVLFSARHLLAADPSV